jgi:hypothetical protein
MGVLAASPTPRRWRDRVFIAREAIARVRQRSSQRGHDCRGRRRDGAERDIGFRLRRLEGDMNVRSAYVT